MRKKIAIVGGGYSSEYEISMQSVEGVCSYIDESKYEAIPVLIKKDGWTAEYQDQMHAIDKGNFSFTTTAGESIVFDAAYVTLHGTPGEDGVLQGYFELIGIPYSCSGVLSCSLTFNKFVCNQYVKNFGIKVANAMHIRKGEDFCPQQIVKQINLPVFVKPNAGGSSFGITKVSKKEDLSAAIKLALEESSEAIVEESITGRELTCGILMYKGEVKALPITEISTDHEFFDYEAKYTKGAAKEITPAAIDSEVVQAVEHTTKLLYQLLDCKGIVRMDYILTEDNELYLLEVNATPGMTQTSLIPQQIAASDLGHQEIFTDIIEQMLKGG